MRVLVYKRTHVGDPDARGRFGIHDCMGQDRSWHYDERRYESRMLTGQTVLLLGFGAIGRRLAARLNVPPPELHKRERAKQPPVPKPAHVNPVNPEVT